MEAIKKRNVWALKIMPGEEVCSTIADFVTKKQLGFSSISGIGQANAIKVGHFNKDKGAYDGKTFDQDVEIVSLTGNACGDGENADKPVVHLHAAFSDQDALLHGGHMGEAFATNIFEIFVTVLSETKMVKRNQESRLKTMVFKKSSK